MKSWIYTVLVLLSTAVVAEPNKQAGSLTLDQAMQRVMLHSPILKTFDYGQQIADTKITQASQSLPYTVKLELADLAGSGAYQDTESLQSTLSFMRVLERGDKRELRTELFQHEASMLRTEQDAQRLDLLAEATRRFLHVVIDQERLVFVKDKRALVKRTANTVEQRIKAGKSPVVERRRLAIAIARAEIEVEHAEHELATSRLKLAAMWGSSSPGFSTAQAALFELPDIASYTQLEQLLANNPDLVRFATAKRLAETRVQLARSKGRGDIEITAGLRHFSQSDDNAFLLSASIPLGQGSRAEPLIKETQLLAQQQELDFEQRRLELQVNLFEVYQELLHAQTAIETLRLRILPEAELALRDYEKGYQTGRYSLIEFTEAQRTLLDARLEAIMAAEKYHRYRIEIERLTGAAVSTGVAL